MQHVSDSLENPRASPVAYSRPLSLHHRGEAYHLAYPPENMTPEGHVFTSHALGPAIHLCCGVLFLFLMTIGPIFSFACTTSVLASGG
jgi:hypothetical protein